MLTCLFFIKNNYVFQNKKCKEWCCFTFMQVSLVSPQIEDSWILESASTFNLFLHYRSCSLWKTYYIHDRMRESNILAIL